VAEEAERLRRIAALDFDYSARELERIDACNLCGGRRHSEVARRDRYGYPAVYRICNRCGLGFLSPRMTAGEYIRFYGNIYRPLVSAYHGRRIDAETVQEEQRAYASELIAYLSGELLSAPEAVLDVGGSTGVVAGAIRDAFGSRTVVLDPSPDELAVAQAAGMETIMSLAEDFDPGERRFDLVLLCQTIDHLLDVSGLNNRGRAFVDVLDVGFMARRLGSIEGAIKIDHPHYLTPATAEAYFLLAGFGITGQRLSDDGHWGYVLEPRQPTEPDWERLGAAVRSTLDEVWELRARAA
jgi:hypothetical protein